MILTNHAGFPPEVVEKMKKDLERNPYGDLEESGKVMRVTTLLNPPYIDYLWRTYIDSPDLVIDTSDMIHMLFGTACHNLLEGAATDHVSYEAQLKKKFLVDGVPVIVVGTADKITYSDNGVCISDNKIVKSASAHFEDKKSYQMQLRFYSLIGGFLDAPEPVSLMLQYYLRDWTPTDAGKPDKFGNLAPKYPYLESEVETWAKEYVEQAIIDRIKAHLPEVPRECTPEERNFGRSPTYVVTQKGKKGYRKIAKSPQFTNEESAMHYMATIKAEKPGKIFKIRASGDIRCKLYCRVSSVCPYARKHNYRKDFS